MWLTNRVAPWDTSHPHNTEVWLFMIHRSILVRLHSCASCVPPLVDMTLDYQSLDPRSHASQSSNLTSLFSQDVFSGQSLYAPGPLSVEPSFSAAAAAAALEPSLTHASDTMGSLNRGISPFQQGSYDSLDFPVQQVPSSRSISHSPMSQHQLSVGSMSPQLTNGLERYISTRPSLIKRARQANPR